MSKKGFSLAAVLGAFSAASASLVVTGDPLTTILQGVAILLVVLWRTLDHSGSGVPDFLERKPRAGAAVKLIEQLIRHVEELERRRLAEGKEPLSEQEIEKLEVKVVEPPKG
jgi:hypothetical protein